MQKRLLGMMLTLVVAQEGPISTLNGGIAVIQAPMTTAAPTVFHDLLRRQDDSTSLCGYVSGNGSNPLTCQGSNFCGFNTGLSAFGCCSGMSGASLVGCNMVTKCYDSSEFSECGQSCQSNTMNAWCTSSAFPYCRKYTTGIFSGFDCYSESGEVDPVLPTAISGYSTLDFSSNVPTTGIASSRSSAADPGQPVGNNAAISATPFTQTQATGTSGAAASTTTAADGGSTAVDVNKWFTSVFFLWAATMTF